MARNNSRDMKKLRELDREILDLRYLYIREQGREAELDKTNSLGSRQIKMRLDKAIRTRDSFEKFVAATNKKVRSTEAELIAKKVQIEEAEIELEELNKSIARELSRIQEAQAYAALNLGFVVDMTTINMLTKEIPIQQLRIRNYKRAYENIKSDLSEVFSPERAKYAGDVLEREIRKAIDNVTKEPQLISHTIEQVDELIKTPEDILGHTPNWEKPINNASFDLLRSSPAAAYSADILEAEPPRKRVVIDI